MIDISDVDIPEMVLPSISPGPYISHFPTICFYYSMKRLVMNIGEGEKEKEKEKK